jgi:hypothetical protein
MCSASTTCVLLEYCSSTAQVLLKPPRVTYPTPLWQRRVCEGGGLQVGVRGWRMGVPSWRRLRGGAWLEAVALEGAGRGCLAEVWEGWLGASEASARRVEQCLRGDWGGATGACETPARSEHSAEAGLVASTRHGWQLARQQSFRACLLWQLSDDRHACMQTDASRMYL